MDIHFCDLCGARVTDVDLRGGHGICRQYDVICATCVELGHGKEWLINSQQRQQRGAVSAQSTPVAKATVPAKPGLPVIPVINEARDRAATLEEGDNAKPISPQVIEAEDHVSETDDLEEDLGSLVSENTPQSVPVIDNHFATAASSFSAMGAQRKRPTDHDDVDDTEPGEGLSDDSTAAPILADDSSPFAPAGKSNKNGDEHSSAFQKDETLPSDRDPMMAEKSIASSSRKATAASASFKRAGSPSGSNSKGSSSKNSRSSNKNDAGSKSKTWDKSDSANPRASMTKSGNIAQKGSGRANAKKQNKNKNIIIMSCISVGILLMLGLIVTGSLSSPKKAPEALPPINLSDNLKTAIKEAKAAAVSALHAKDVTALQAAKAKIQGVVPEIYKWSDEAKKQGYSDDELGDSLDAVGFPEVNSLQRNINEMLIIQQGSR